MSVLMTDKTSVDTVPWKPHIEKNQDKSSKKKYQDIRGVSKDTKTNRKEQQTKTGGIQRYVSQAKLVKQERA